MEHVVERQELVKRISLLIEVVHPLQPVLPDRPDHRLTVVAGGQERHLGQRLAERPALLRLEQGKRLRARIGLGDRRDDRRSVEPEDLAEIGIGGVLVEDHQGHRAVLASAATAWFLRLGSREILENHVAGVGARGLASARSPRSPNSTTRRRASAEPAAASTSPVAAT